VIQRLALRVGLNSENVINLAIYCALAGLAGSKLLMYVFDWSYYSQHPSEIFSLATLRAGGVFQGGLVGALIVAILYMRNKKLPVWQTADCFAPGIAIGHAIGRLGCFMAGCCWGSECHLPWAVTFTNLDAHNMFGTPLDIPLHPAQLYEAFTNILVFAFVYRAFGKPHRPGQIIGMYLVFSSTFRFIIEFFRFHEQGLIGPLSLTQWIAAGLFALGLWLWLRKAEARMPLPQRV
jgi:phosphatidylglycerol---prolipoprotein diacylglyceryl transferase